MKTYDLIKSGNVYFFFDASHSPFACAVVGICNFPEFITLDVIPPLVVQLDESNESNFSSKSLVSVQ